MKKKVLSFACMVNAAAWQHVRSHCVTSWFVPVATLLVTSFEQVVSVNTRDISYNIGRVTIFTSVACRPIKFLNSSWSSYTVVFACGCRRIASHNWIYIVLIHAIYAIYIPQVSRAAVRALSNSRKTNYIGWTLCSVFTIMHFHSLSRSIIITWQWHRGSVSET